MSAHQRQSCVEQTASATFERQIPTSRQWAARLLSLSAVVSIATLVCEFTPKVAAETDLLGGNGFKVKLWQEVKPGSYTATVAKEADEATGEEFRFIDMTKDSDTGFFDDGFVYLFDKADVEKEFTPKHISYWIQTSADSADLESCNLRLSTWTLPEEDDADTEEEEDAVEASPAGPPGFERQALYDVAFVRFGYFNYLKLNGNPMVMKFEGDIWYKIDLVIDWEEQKVLIRAEGGAGEEPEVRHTVEPFFTKRKQKINSANGVSIYGLSPGSVSRFRDLKVCEEICQDENEEVDLLGLMSGALSGLTCQTLALLTVPFLMLLQ